MLCDLPTVKTFLNIPASDNTQDATLSLLLPAADQVVKRYCLRLLETSVILEYPRLRGGAEALVLEQTPVLCYRQTGNLVNGQATITGIPSTSNLLVGMPVLQAVSSNGPAVQPFANGTVIASVDSATQVTASSVCTAATQSGVPLVFGLAVWFDPLGSFGDGIGSDPAGPFAASALLRAGMDYSLRRDQPDGSSKSGMLIRLGSTFGYLGMSGSWGGCGNYWSGLQSRCSLSGPLPPLWPPYPHGSIQVQYAAGLGFGAPVGGVLPADTTLPADLTLATAALTAWMLRAAETGLMQVQSESFGGYSVSVASAVDALKTASELGSTRQILARYRRVAL